MSNKHQISASALEMVLNAEKNNNGASFTILSNRTGKDYTYKITRSVFKNKWYTHVSVEKNYMEFERLGSYFNGKIYRKSSVVETPSAIAIAFVLKKVEEGKFQFLDENVKIMHLGCCLRCGRALTDAKSISIGLGAKCRSM